MTLFSIALYLIPIFIGALVVHLIWKRNGPKILFVKFALGIGIGIGVTSLLYFVFLFTNQSWFLLLLLVILLVLIFASIRTWQPSSYFHLTSLTRLQKALLFILAIVIIIDLATFLSISLRRPHGYWDSWAVWNRAARFIFRGGENWQQAFSDDLFWIFHADYPPLVPLTTAWAWDVLNVETLRVPMVQAGIYLFSSGMLLFSGLLATRSIGTASLAAIVLLTMPNFVAVSSGQLADAPLAIFILATAMLFYLYSQYHESQILILAGITTALAAWTKNEGAVFLFSSLIGLFVLCYRDKQAWQLVKRYLVGLCIPLSVVLVFKSAVAPAGDLVPNLGSTEIWQHMTDPTRYLLTLEAFSEALFRFEVWGYNIPSFLLYYLIMRDREIRMLHRGWLAVFAILTTQLLAYLGTYIFITPHDLEWHVYFSLDRILLHAYPTALFLLFSITAKPESLFQSQKESAMSIIA